MIHVYDNTFNKDTNSLNSNGTDNDVLIFNFDVAHQRLLEIAAQDAKAKEVRRRRRKKLLPFKALIISLYEKGHSSDRIAQYLRERFRVRVDRSTVYRNVIEWKKQKEEVVDLL